MRMGYAARCVPTCVRVYPDTDVIQEYGGSVSLERYGAVLVCGRNDFSHNRIVTETTRGHAFTTR
jgi:non-haem Fe2+, alpha-ketoglutarate-dependent halogenase